MVVGERTKPTSGTPITPGGVRQLTLGEITLLEPFTVTAVFGFINKVSFILICSQIYKCSTYFNKRLL